MLSHFLFLPNKSIFHRSHDLIPLRNSRRIIIKILDSNFIKLQSDVLSFFVQLQKRKKCSCSNKFTLNFKVAEGSRNENWFWPGQGSLISGG
jgi:hypothetical protein